MSEKVPDIFAAITEDLEREHAAKGRHFAPALGVVAVALIALMLVMGTRGDLWTQPSWRLGLQCLSWITCLVLFPAIGVGLWFPGRGTRVVLALGAVLLTGLCALGWPIDTSPSAVHSPCALLVLMGGLVVFGVGALSGAFAQRRSRASVFWVAAGVALAALASVTWICPTDAASHVTRMHLGPALGVAALAGALGAWLHKRLRTHAGE